MYNTRMPKCKDILKICFRVKKINVSYWKKSIYKCVIEYIRIYIYICICEGRSIHALFCLRDIYRSILYYVYTHFCYKYHFKYIW